MLLVIFGGRTRLAASLLTSPWVKAQQVALVARTPEDAAVLGRLHPAAMIVPAWEPMQSLGQHSEVGVACCALGVIHPDEPSPCRDIESTFRDVTLLEAVLGRFGQAAASLVFISSVIARAPNRGREFYGGLKAVLEGTVSALALRHGNCRLTVICPGRMADRRTFRRPITLLYSSYNQVASLVERGLRGGSGRRLVGLDARLWMGLAALRTGLAGVSGRLG